LHVGRQLKKIPKWPTAARKQQRQQWGVMQAAKLAAK